MNIDELKNLMQLKFEHYSLMNNKIELEMPIPSINNYWKPNVRGGQYKGTYLTDKGKKYKEALGWAAKAICKDMIKGKVRLSILIEFKNINRDIDNCLKPIFDGLEGIVYENDKQVFEFSAGKIKGNVDRLSIRFYDLEE